MLAGQEADREGHLSPAFPGLAAGSLRHKPGAALRGVADRAPAPASLCREQRAVSECPGVAVTKCRLNTAEARISKSRRQQGHYTPYRGSTGGSFLLLPAPGAPGILGSWAHPSSLCLRLHGAFLRCVSESKFPSSYKDGLVPTLVHTHRTFQPQ